MPKTISTLELYLPCLLTSTFMVSIPLPSPYSSPSVSSPSPPIPHLPFLYRTSFDVYYTFPPVTLTQFSLRISISTVPPPRLFLCSVPLTQLFRRRAFYLGCLRRPRSRCLFIRARRNCTRRTRNGKTTQKELASGKCLFTWRQHRVLRRANSGQWELM